MSSSQNPQNNDEGGETGNDEVVTMDTTDAVMAANSEATSIWDQARENSSKMVLQSVMNDMENRAAKQKEELQQLRRRAEDAESGLSKSRKTIEQLEKTLLQHGETTKGLEKKVRETSTETEVLRVSSQTEQERADRAGAESDRLREEISRLTKSNQSYQMQLADAEAKAKLDGSSLLPLQFKNQRLETENDNVRTHSTWLEGELREKSEELARLKSSSALHVAQARTNTDTAQSERDELSIEAKQLREQLDRDQRKMEAIARELLSAKQEVSDVRLDSEEELTSSRRLVDLQKEQLIRMQQKHDSLAKQIDAMKAIAGEAESEDNARWKEREQEMKAVSDRVFKKQTEEYENKLETMRKDVENANERCKRAEDGLLLIEGPSAAEAPARLALPPIRRNSDENDEQPTLTDLYGRVAQAEDALNTETIRRKKAEIRVARIEAEIEANAPLLIRQRKEYELAIQTQRDMQSRVEDAQDEAAASRQESNILQAEVTRLRSENKDLIEEGKELAKQVRDMLIAQSSGVENPHVALTVAQMQSANQRLLTEYRKLTAEKEELEAKLRQEDLHQEIEDYKSELATLVEDRKRQESIVEKIVQQRDLYRTLLNKQDTNLLAGGDESTALAIVRGQSERAKAMEEQIKQLAKEHGEAKAQLDVMKRDQEVASERLMRYEVLNNELTKSIDSANLEISKGNAAVARSEAEAAFYKDKTRILEETQQRNREEIKNVTASKNRIMQLNTDIEKVITKSNNECSKVQDELRQAKSKLRLAQAETDATKAAEKRIAEESNQLRNELSRQGAVLDGVQRIESSLLLKNNTDIEAYKLQITNLKEKLLSVEKKQESVLAELKAKIAGQELELKQLETEKVSASKEALEARKESLDAAGKVNALETKCALLDRHLKIAKKKLGETDGTDIEDVESQLRAKLDSLSTDLESSKKETETWRARSATYEKLAKDSEAAVTTLTEASDAAKKSLEENIAKMKEEAEITATEMSKRKEIIAELTNDLSAQRDEREKAVNKVKQQIEGFKADAEKHKNKAEDMEGRFSQLQKDVANLQSDLMEAQSNYERELSLHAAVRTDLRTAREDSDKANHLRNAAMEEAATLQSKFKVHQANLEAEKSQREEAQKDFEKKIGNLRAENTLLHGQLEKINEQIGEMQSRNTSDVLQGDSKLEDVSEDEEMMKLRMNVAELRELVKFVRAEKDSIQGQLDAARRSAERERTKASIARRAVEETQAELNALKEPVENKSDNVSDDIASMTEKIKATEEKSRLLGDSNAHLQQRVQELQNNLNIAQNDLGISKSALQPATERQKELEADKAALLAEKESLLREINDWKGRVQSLVSTFNQVDPEDHSKALKKVETLEKQVKLLVEKKTTAEEETKRIRTLASRASSQLSQNKQMVESQKKAIAKLTAEKDALLKSQKESASKKDLEELREKILKLEKERDSSTNQLKLSTTMNGKLRDRLRQFQKTMIDLRKEKEMRSKQLAEAQSIVEQKKAVAAKAVATLREKKGASEIAVGNNSTTAASVPTEPMTKDIPAKGKVAAPVSKETTANAASSTDSNMVTEKKEEKQILPKVPSGGFKFAPSKTTTTASAGSILLKKKSQTESGKKEILTISKNKTPLAGPPSSEEKADGEAKTDKELVSSPKRPLAPKRRTSTETKEMSLKDKLMEKKRKLIELKKAKEARLEDSNDQESFSVEPISKRNKTESGIDKETTTSKPQDNSTTTSLNPKVAAFVPNVTVLKEAAAKMTAKVASPDNNPTKGVPNEDCELKESEGKPLEGQTSTLNSPGSSSGNVFGGGTKASASFGSGFGSGSTATFGKSSGFGSVATGFGSSAAPSGKSTFAFGSKKPSTTPSSNPTFGGAAFLNIKPPGKSSGTAPQFSFGNSGSSITLPTPSATAPNPKLNMFNAFSSPTASQPFGTQVTAKPLFGTTKEKKEEEDGELPDTTK